MTPHAPDDLLTTPHSPGKLILLSEYGLSARHPIHKSHLKAYMACPRAFELRMIQGFGPSNPGQFVTGRLYHDIMRRLTGTQTNTRSCHATDAILALSPQEKLALNAGSLKHAAILASKWKAGPTGIAEKHWSCQIPDTLDGKPGTGFWFAGAWDLWQPHEPLLIDWKTNHLPCQHEADHGPEGIVYRLAHQSMYGTLAPLRFVRLSQLWDTGKTRRPASILADKPIEPLAWANVMQAIHDIRQLANKHSSSRRVTADCHYCPVASLCMKPDHLLPPTSLRSERNASP